MTESGRVQQTQDAAPIADVNQLWIALLRHQDAPFQTAKGLTFRYYIRGGEMFVSRKTRSITKSTIEMAFRRAGELNGIVSGPKKLGVFGASYLYSIFLAFGIIKPAP
ncbi:MAG: hypothetical protein LUE95_03025 [Oscillospiraceae bacterium]|nr:hypothetical protein [Oscillospiraceae bacterium]MCD7743463.1 hypothetical protein [Oscillospiraceae bacterium]MCD8001548.1 hypothetical protein [Oscillospiraceae bacterium]MCD8128569.1 hypothetical protein [Oscillospiraceae bacterium]MCD8256924.1 hypothetical protein [Oscillospiraceae bacterium]